MKGSEEEENWRRTHPQGWKASRGTRYETGTTEAHISAKQNDVKNLKKVLDKQKDLVHATDQNGWTPLHEAVRSGCYDCVINLIQRGADINALTIDGSSPLYYAKKFHAKKTHNNMISQFLKAYGAKEMGPEL